MNHTSTENKNILIAPAHYMLDQYGSSEYLWSYKIIDTIAKNHSELNFFVIAGTSNVKNWPKNVKIFEIAKDKNYNWQNLYHKFIFIWRYFWLARRILKEQNIYIIHHLLPFSLLETFSPLALLGYTKKKKFIIGPLQAQTGFVEFDIEGIMSREFQKRITKINKIKTYFFYLFTKLLKPILRLLSRRTLQKADAVIVINEYAKEQYSQVVIPKKITIIPPGIDLEKYHYDRNYPTTRSEILVVNYLIKRKAVHLIIEAFARIKEQFPNIMLRIVGEGPEKEALQKIANDLECSRQVVFTGFVPNTEIAKYYHYAIILATMSLADTFGQVILEAMASGAIVVASETIGSKGIIVNKQTGFLIPQKDVQKLTETFKKILLADNKINDVAMAAYREVENKYDWNKISRNYYQIYCQN